jgi:hypothetical protein
MITIQSIWRPIAFFTAVYRYPEEHLPLRSAVALWPVSAEHRIGEKVGSDVSRRNPSLVEAGEAVNGCGPTIRSGRGRSCWICCR